MRVNSVCNGIFANGLATGGRLMARLVVVFLITSSFTEHPGHDLQAKQVNLRIRQIGDRLLLQAGDSTSRILPVSEDNEGTFLLRFENELIFNHDSLMTLTRNLLPKTQFPSGYTVTVHDCRKEGIVYGFQVSNASPDILACSGRNQPPGCYTIEFAFPDFDEYVKQQKAAINPLTQSVEADTDTGKAKLGAVQTASSGRSSVERKLRSGKPDINESNAQVGASATTIFGYPSSEVVYATIIVFLSATLMIWRFRKPSKPGLGQDQAPAACNETATDLAALGKFLFNVKGQRLIYENEVVSLTDKECKVLYLLHQNFGALIARETLMQEVWINEGVITGRSLDMFVSKLRKKLSRDPELRITNVHGKGYKLEIPEKQAIPSF